MCSGQMRMPLGSLFVTGVSSSREIGEFLVFDGTGEYEQARGLFRFISLSSSRLSVRVQY
jgi:hypothetical protein